MRKDKQPVSFQRPLAVKIIHDFEWSMTDRLRAGMILPVTRADVPERPGQAFTVCVQVDEYVASDDAPSTSSIERHHLREVIVRPHLFTTDLSADPDAVWRTRVASLIQNGYKEWIARPDRERSPESDFGGWYSLNGEKNPAAHRWSVSWIEDTGEIYARCEHTDEYILLGMTKPGDESQVERALDGWSNPDLEVFHNLQALWEQIQQRGASVRG
jgi:hypothetical protein